MIFLETYEFAVFIESQKEHLQAIIDSKWKPVCTQAHQKLEKDEIDTFFTNCSLESHYVL